MAHRGHRRVSGTRYEHAPPARVSQGVYIGGKIASTTALSRAQALKAELDLTKEARKNADDEAKRLATKRADLEAKKTAGHHHGVGGQGPAGPSGSHQAGRREGEGSRREDR